MSYDEGVKVDILGVSRETIDSFGVVSNQTAQEMVQGASRATGADCVVSITGVAGPSGGTEEVPVGTVCFGVYGPTGSVAETCYFAGTREQVRSQAVLHALNLFEQTLS